MNDEVSTFLLTNASKVGEFLKLVLYNCKLRKHSNPKTGKQGDVTKMNNNPNSIKIWFGAFVSFG